MRTWVGGPVPEGNPLPWDAWGARWEPGEKPTSATLEHFDRVAELTVDPDASFAAVRDFYENDDSMRVDGTVFDVLRARTEEV